MTPGGALPPCKRHVMSPSSPVGVKARAASGPCGLRDFDKGAIYGLWAAQGNPETSRSGRGQLPSLGLRREERGRKSPMWSRVSWEVGTDCPRALWSCGHSQGQSRGPTEKRRPDLALPTAQISAGASHWPTQPASRRGRGNPRQRQRRRQAQPSGTQGRVRGECPPHRNIP